MEYKSKNKISVMNIENPQKETIKKIIKDKNLNYRNIANLLNISLSKVHRIIKQNRFSGDYELQEKLAVILNVDVNYIFPVIEITSTEKKELQEYYKRIKNYAEKDKRREQKKTYRKNAIYTKDKRLKNKYEDRIKEILKSKNMTITELAKIFNISKVAMFVLITTVTKKHSKQRQRIADFLNVPYDSIFEAKKNDLKK